VKIKIKNKAVEITGQKVRSAVHSVLFQNWTASLDPALTVHQIEIQSVDTVIRSGEKYVLFLKLKAEVTDSNGKKLPGIIFLRGGSVGIFVLLKTEKNEYVVLVQSAYAATGIKTYPQLPAGMMDNEKEVLKVAMREMQEETGLSADDSLLLNLTRTFYGSEWRGIYPSPGACDEVIELFLYRCNMTEDEVHKLQGQKTGLVAENENLVLRVVKLEEVCRFTPDVKAHSAYIMYTQLKHEGRI
jgi:ADP-sugar diphosphatase